MIHRQNHIFIVLCGLLFSMFSPKIYAQETIVVGQVFSKTDHTPLEFVHIYFKGADTYTQTNDEGYFLIRNSGKESVLVFSLIGYKKEEINVKPGTSVGLEMLLVEKENVLGELFVRPGANPANDLMQKVRENRKKNNIRAHLTSKEQSAVFLSKNDSRRINNKLYAQFKSGNLSRSDSALLVPLYMEESTYRRREKKKEQTGKNTFNTPETSQKAISTLLGGMNSEVNFYENTVSVLGKSLISPLAGIGKTYYRYYLMDSTKTGSGKQYTVHFRTKNSKNLAFNGEMGIDSATLALTYINAELPHQANLNYIHNVFFQQTFSAKNKVWIPSNQNSAWDLTYELLKDTIHNTSPELMIRKSAVFFPENEILTMDTANFANSDYSQRALEDKMTVLKQAPLFKTASWIADAALTGYMRAGIFDIGKITTIMRQTKVEGFRIGLPVRTNERLWKNFMLGAFAAYGFRDKALKYGAEAQWKLPFENTRIILGTKYANDYRRVDYDYNDYMWREDPLAVGDEDFISTILYFGSANKMSKREEFSTFLENDWNDDIESYYTYRHVKYFANEWLPMIHNGVRHPALIDNNFSFATRFSFGERVINEHFQRLYLKNSKPVIYAIFEGGKYQLADENGNYMKVTGKILHRGSFALGEWRYMISAGKIFGTVPYPLLEFIYGKSGGVYNRFEFSLMNSCEYAADAYGTFFGEIITNGIIFNNIPFVKKLNLREIAGFKMGYGALNNGHAKILDLPQHSSTFTHPYSEISVGFCNLLGVLSVQSIWRLTDLDKTDIKKWGIKLNLMFSF